MQMISLYKDPAGKDVFSNTVPTHRTVSIQSDTQHLQDRVQQLEKQLTQVC